MKRLLTLLLLPFAFSCKTRTFSNAEEVKPKQVDMIGEYYEISFERRFSIKLNRADENASTGSAEVYERMEPNSDNSPEALFAVFPKCSLSVDSFAKKSKVVICGDGEITEPSATRPKSVIWRPFSYVALPQYAATGNDEPGSYSGDNPFTTLGVEGVMNNGDRIGIGGSWCYSKRGETYCRAGQVPKYKKMFNVAMTVNRKTKAVEATISHADGSKPIKAKSCKGDEYVDMPGDQFRLGCQFDDFRMYGRISDKAFSSPIARPSFEFTKNTSQWPTPYSQVEVPNCQYVPNASNESNKVYSIKCQQK